jgi:hypothetical protein
MTERIGYLIKENHCEKAIEDFKMLTSVPKRLSQYLNLYDSVSIKPDGLPRITSYHFEGETLENIQLFAHLYGLVKSLFADICWYKRKYIRSEFCNIFSKKVIYTYSNSSQ